MSKKPLYNVGDIVKIKSLEKLQEDLGNPINAICGWVSSSMDKFAGHEYRILVVEHFSFGGGHYCYRFEETDNWWFSEDTFEEELFDIEPAVEDVQISYEECMNILHKK